MRSWEWYYINRLCRVEPLILRDACEVYGVAFAPDGRPDVVNVTAVAVPETRLAVADVVAVPPAVTVPAAGSTERAKSNPGGGDSTVKV